LKSSGIFHKAPVRPTSAILHCYCVDWGTDYLCGVWHSLPSV